jgi:hypothetical protein
VITFCREDAAREGQPPACGVFQLSGVGTKEFTTVPEKARQARGARIAGLPKPHGCI